MEGLLPQQKFVLFIGSHQAYCSWHYVLQIVERLGGACGVVDSVYEPTTGSASLVTVRNGHQVSGNG